MNMLSFEPQDVANSLHSEHSLARSSSGVSLCIAHLFSHLNIRVMYAYMHINSVTYTHTYIHTYISMHVYMSLASLDIHAE